LKLLWEHLIGDNEAEDGMVLRGITRAAVPFTPGMEIKSA
jgi:hypothetical protein